VTFFKPLPFRGGVGVGQCLKYHAVTLAETPTPNPSPKGEGLFS
jgi:hypothetical protein